MNTTIASPRLSSWSSDWPDLLKSGWNHIEKHREVSRISAWQVDPPVLPTVGWYQHALELNAAQNFSGHETRRLLQIVHYFHDTLLGVLNPSILEASDDSANRLRSDRARDEIINRLEEARTMEDLRSINQSFRSQNRIQIFMPGCDHTLTWILTVRITLEGGDALVNQVQDLLSIAEAAIAWQGGGLQGLRKWPNNVLGLRRFLANRGKGSVMERDLPDRRFRLRTPFPAAMGGLKGKIVDVSQPIKGFATDERGTRLPMLER